MSLPTRNAVLTDHQQEFIEALVASGRYQNPSAVLRECPRGGRGCASLAPAAEPPPRP
ncbi:type II toxin-antitoxin system ParD family antitoxin [Ruania zhangjianzhongii]|uniref:ribbon-helix-helix domain-containing protein n=1 Tax=Ruania zhangjianzhongii TaxID=2603206 RepID=UPI001AEFF50F